MPSSAQLKALCRRILRHILQGLRELLAPQGVHPLHCDRHGLMVELVASAQQCRDDLLAGIGVLSAPWRRFGALCRFSRVLAHQRPTSRIGTLRRILGSRGAEVDSLSSVDG